MFAAPRRFACTENRPRAISLVQKSMKRKGRFSQNSKFQLNKIVDHFGYRYIPIRKISFYGEGGFFQVSNGSEEMTVLMSVSVNMF